MLIKKQNDDNIILNRGDDMDRRILLSKMMLQEALIKILEQKKLSEISVLELCEKANVNRTTFYKYYRDISDLLDEIKAEFVVELANILKMYNMKEDNDKAITKIMLLLKEKGKYAKVLLGKNVNQAFLDDLYPYFIKKSSLNKDSKKNKAVIDGYFIMLYYGSIGLIRNWLNNDFNLSIEEITEIIKNISTYYYELGDE